MARVQCRFLGPLEVLVDGAPAPAELLWRKNVGLLTYLACAPTSRGRERDHLAALLWANDERGRHSLSQAVGSLRRLLGEGVLVVDPVHLALAPGVVSTDLQAFAAHEAAGAWAEAGALAQGDFLAGFAIPDADGYDDWLGAERALWRARMAQALARAARAAGDQGDLPAALVHVARATTLDPDHGPAHAEALRTRALAGDAPGALADWDAFCRSQAASYGTTPAAEHVRLAERVRRLPARPPADRLPAPLGAALQQLLHAVDTAVRAPRGTLLLLEAPAPAGASRLLDELLARLHLDGTATARVQARDPGARPWAAFHAFAEAGVLGFPGITGAAPNSLAVLAATFPAWAERFPNLAITSPDTPPMVALAEVLCAAADEAPVVLALEDAHRADPSTGMALGAVLTYAARLPLVLLVTRDPAHTPPALDGLRARADLVIGLG